MQFCIHMTTIEGASQQRTTYVHLLWKKNQVIVLRNEVTYINR